MSNVTTALALKVATAVTASGTAVAGKHNPVDATSGALSIALPTGKTEGSRLVVEKTDSTANAVTLAGSIRGVGAQTIALTLNRESVELVADAAGSWWPIAGHKTLASIQAAMAAALAPIQRPSTLPGSTALAKVFDARTSAYNVTPTSLKRARAYAAGAFAGTGRLDIVCLGTSLVAGTGAATKAGSWPAQLQAMLVNKGYPDGGSGFIAAQSNNSATTDPRVSFGAGWSAYNPATSWAMKASSSTGATFTDNKASTVVDVFVLDYTTFGFSWTIDGVAQTDIATTNAGGLIKVTVAGLTSASHTVVITPKTGVSSGSPMYVMGVSFRKTTGVVVHNLGIGGALTQDITDQTAIQSQKPWQTAVALAPNLTILETGANDGTALSGYSTRVQTAITSSVANGGDILLCAEPPAGTTSRPNGTGLQEYPLLYALADSNDVALVDMYDRMVSWTSLAALGMGYATDALTVHLTAAGYAEQARTFLNALGL